MLLPLLSHGPAFVPFSSPIPTLPKPSCVCFSIVLCVMGVCTMPGAPADSRRESWLKWNLKGELGEMIQVDMKD